MTDEEASRIALTLPEAVQEGTGFRVADKGFAWFYSELVPGRKGRILHRDVLAVRVTGEDEKQALIASAPEKFFTDDHYRGYPAILVRLDAIKADELTEILTDAWRLRAPKRMVKAFDVGRGTGE